jgi:hypothetical protein
MRQWPQECSQNGYSNDDNNRSMRASRWSSAFIRPVDIGNGHTRTAACAGGRKFLTSGGNTLPQIGVGE